MTAALTEALKVHDPDWMTAGLHRSFLRTIGGVMYAVLVAENGNVVAVYRVSRKRMRVRLAEFWPRALAEELI